MVALEVWHNQRPGDDFQEEDAATVVATAEELRRLLDDVTAGRDGQVPPMLEVSVAEDPASPTLEVGLSETRGFVHFMSRDEDGWTVGEIGASGTVAYDYAGSLQEIPAQAEVSADAVRQAIAEFLQTGRKPVGTEIHELATE